MLKFGTPTIALPLAIKKCTVQTGCAVVITTVIEMVEMVKILMEDLVSVQLSE